MKKSVKNIYYKSIILLIYIEKVVQKLVVNITNN